jgi:hypothetical protein
MNWLGIIAATIGSLITLVPVAFVAYVNIGGIRHAVKLALKGKASSLPITSLLTCATDSDCPEGYLCVNGKCVAQLS